MTTQIQYGDTVLGTITREKTAVLDTADKHLTNNIIVTVTTLYYDGTVTTNEN